jgi:hypothetical protein
LDCFDRSELPAYFVAGFILGGFALGGCIEDGHNYLALKPDCRMRTEVSPAVFEYSRWHGYTLWGTIIPIAVISTVRPPAIEAQLLAHDGGGDRARQRAATGGLTGDERYGRFWRATVRYATSRSQYK